MIGIAKSDNKRIAKNTLFLYFRMLLVMGVSLFTTRIVLKTLGVEDFGIFNVVGGIVVMFSFLSSTMSSASQRFFAIELGRENYERLNQVFSLTMLIYAALSLVIILCAETIGLWFLNTQMTIPQERLVAANWVYQFSILSFVVTIMMIPYHAAVIVQEDMKAFALISVVEVLLKLGVVYLLLLFDIDKLKLYAILIFSVTVIIQGSYYFFCKKHYSSYNFTFYVEKRIFLDMLGFAGWNMIGALAHILRSQGVNILLNMFFNPAINAARAVAYQVNSAISNFVNNFYMAVRPQIFKKYSAGEIEGMHDLVLNSARYAYLLMFVIVTPVFFETDYVLSLWLKNVPNYTVLFTRLVLANALLEVFNNPLVTAIQANGNIRNYQLIVSVVNLLNIPISYVLLKMGYPPETVLYVTIGLVIINFIPRLLLCKKIVSLSIRRFLTEVMLKVLLCSCFAVVLIECLKKTTQLHSLIFMVVELMISILVAIFVGVSRSERRQGLLFFRKRIADVFS